VPAGIPATVGVPYSAKIQTMAERPDLVCRRRPESTTSAVLASSQRRRLALLGTKLARATISSSVSPWAPAQRRAEKTFPCENGMSQPTKSAAWEVAEAGTNQTRLVR
jgi:hypothetical protein